MSDSQSTMSDQPITESDDSPDKNSPAKPKYAYGMLFIGVGLAVLIGVFLQFAGNSWFGMCYAVAVALAAFAVWRLSRDPDFWLVGNDGNLNPEVSAKIRGARRAMADWIETQDKQTPLTPGRRLLAILGVYLGGALVLVPVCAVCLPQDWPHRVLTGFGAAFCLVALDVIIASQTTKWPTVLRGTRSFLKGTIGGAALAGTWIVSIALFIGASHAMREHREQFNPRPQLPSHALTDQLRAAVQARPTRDYWYGTICPLLDTPLTPESPQPDETTTDFLDRAFEAKWLADIKQAAQKCKNVDEDLVVTVNRFIRERQEALMLFEKLFRPRVGEHGDQNADAIMAGANGRLAELAAQDIKPVDLNTTMWDLMMAEAQRSGDQDYEQALSTFAAIQESLEQQAYDAYELRGRLSERYPEERLSFPWEDDVGQD